MKEKIISVARELIRTYGFSLLDDTERLGQLLEDRCGDSRHEIFLLCFALREVSKNGGYPSSEDLLDDRERYEEACCSNLGFSPFVARRSIDAIALLLSDAESASSTEVASHVEARRGFIQGIFQGMAKRPRTAPARKKALRNGLLLLGIIMIFVVLYARISGGRFSEQSEHNVLFLAHLSGPGASGGHQRLKAAQMAADITNDQGGVKGRRIRVIAQDMPIDPESAAKSLSSVLVDRTITAMISACNDDVCARLALIADDHEIPMISSEASTMAATVYDDRPLLYSFRLNYDNVYRGRVMVYFVVNALKREKIALLSPAYDPDAAEIVSSVMESFASARGDVVCTPNYTRLGGLDAASLSEISASSADCIIIADTSPEFAGVIAGLRSSGFKGPILSTVLDDGEGSDIAEAIDDCWWIVPSSPDDPALRSFQTGYRDRYNEAIQRHDLAGAMLAYDSVMWMTDALFRAPGFQGEALRHAFLSTRNLALAHATLSIDPRTHGPWNKSVSLLYSSKGTTSFQRRFRPQ